MTIDITKTESLIVKKTRTSLLGTSLLNEVLITFFGLMPFLLRKDLLATTFQISLFTMLKPAVSVFSFYWSSRIVQSKNSLRYNLVIAGILARLPFLFFFFFHSVWYMIFASAMYMLFSRAAIPAWMEILKLNLQKRTREKLFSLGAILGYSEGVLIALFMGGALDAYANGWKIMLVGGSLLGLAGVFLQWRTPIFEEKIVKQRIEKSFLGIIKPWKEGIELLRRRPDFAKYQIGSTITVFGFMLAIPSMYLFYADHLQLSHTEMTIGRYIFMGLGFVFFSPLWARAMQKISIHRLTGYAGLGFALFPLLIMLALWSKIWIFLAFLSYGITQGGSHLIWNLSGPMFAKEEDSSKFTGINVLMIGIRGLVAPLLGGMLCEFFGPIIVFFIAIFFCCLGSCYMFSKQVFIFRKRVG